MMHIESSVMRIWCVLYNFCTLSELVYLVSVRSIKGKSTGRLNNWKTYVKLVLGGVECLK